MTGSSRSRRPRPLDGLFWLSQGLLANRRYPLSLVGVTMFYVAVVVSVTLLPLVGPAISAILRTFGIVFVARAARDALAGRRPGFAPLREVLRDRRSFRPLFFIGLVFAAGSALTGLVFDLLSADTVALWTQLDDGRMDWESVRQNIPWPAIGASLTVYLPTVMITLFSPLLVAERRMTLCKSLFYSFFGCLTHLLPLITLWLALTLLGTAVGALAILVISAFSLFGYESFFLLPASLAVATLTYACYWPAYAGIFGSGGEARAPAGPSS